jgi:hypothetical protein
MNICPVLNIKYFFFVQIQLFNADIFQKTTNPWLENVFSKKFDAYFFIQFPHVRYVHAPIEPFDFLNNISENTLQISTPDGSRIIEFVNEKWENEPFFVEFQEKLADERFLFWRGLAEKWAMVSDAKSGFAVIGIDWKISGQVPFFFQNFLLSTKKVAELLADDSLEKLLAQTYAPAKILTEGSDENPVWVKFHFRGNVETEDDKIFYWPQFGQLFDAISAATVDFQTRFMWADQAFSRRYWRNKMWYASNSNAAVGGWQKYSRENCEKVATKFLPQNQHLKLLFEGKQAEADKLYIANKKGLIEFMYFWVYANVEKKRKPEGAMQFYFLLEWMDFYKKEKPIPTNQGFQLFYQKSTISAERIEKLVEDLTKIGFAKVIYRLERPEIAWKINVEGLPEISNIYSASPDFESNFDVFKFV